MVGSCERAYETLGPIKCGELHSQPRNYLIASQEGFCSMELVRSLGRQAVISRRLIARVWALFYSSGGS